MNVSSATSGQKSLNDVLYKGYSSQNNLFSLLIRWRTRVYVITADLQKAFLQIRRKATAHSFDNSESDPACNKSAPSTQKRDIWHQLLPLSVVRGSPKTLLDLFRPRDGLKRLVGTVKGMLHASSFGTPNGWKKKDFDQRQTRRRPIASAPAGTYGPVGFVSNL